MTFADFPTVEHTLESMLPLGLTLSMQNYQREELRQTVSRRSPLVYHAAIEAHRIKRSGENIFRSFASTKAPYFSSVLARHQSLLMKKLGENNEELQRQKIQNLQIAADALDGVVIQPGQELSVWNLIGRPNARRGFVPGMLLSRGKVVSGVGGGLCQMGNLLHWMFLHAPVKIVERYHHSYDVFPDSGRVLPFGSGATLFYNYVDLVIKNTSDVPLQLKVWLTESHLKGQILTEVPFAEKIKVREENHLFLSWKGKWFRYNELYRETYIQGVLQQRTLALKNFAPVLYEVDPEVLRGMGYRIETI